MTLENFRQSAFVTAIKAFLTKYERPVSSIFLINGFVVDFFVLKRVDEPLENFFVGIHLLVAALGITLLHLFEEGKDEGARMSVTARKRIRYWSLIIVQFAFGGLLSVFLVFYFRSGSLATSWPFFILLIAAFVANERLKAHYSRLVFQVSMLFLSMYAFAIYIVPVLLHRIGDDVFLISGALSLAAILLFVELLWLIAREHFVKKRLLLFGTILGILASMNALYFLRLIPPIPLSLEDSGVFHSLAKDSAGDYVVTAEKKDARSFFSLYEPVHIVAGDSLYVYSAIFSPAAFNTGIVHEWQHYNETTKKWETVSRIPLAISGGRSGGFRTYSVKSNLAFGKWKVIVENQAGQVIGRIAFNVVQATAEPLLVTSVK